MHVRVMRSMSVECVAASVIINSAAAAAAEQQEEEEAAAAASKKKKQQKKKEDRNHTQNKNAKLYNRKSVQISVTTRTVDDDSVDRVSVESVVDSWCVDSTYVFE